MIHKYKPSRIKCTNRLGISENLRMTADGSSNFFIKKIVLFLSYFTFRFFKALFIDGFVIHAKHRLFRAKGTKNYLCTGLIFVNSLLISLSLKKSQYRFFNANICKNMKHWYPEIQYICNFTSEVTQINYCNGSSSILKEHL